MALTLFDEMTTVLAENANAGFQAVKDTVGSILSGIGNAVVSSTSLARFDANDTKENITGYTGNNSSDAGLVSRKDRVSNTFMLVSPSPGDFSFCF